MPIEPKYGESGLGRDPEEYIVPKTLYQTMLEKGEIGEEKAKKGMTYPVNSLKWYDPKLNEEVMKDFWAAPSDARNMQQNRTNACWYYFTDYFRCKELLGEDYKPCQFFKNSYKDVCPRSWTNKWEEAIEENRFPFRFDR